jgi:hypothetical protein
MMRRELVIAALLAAALVSSVPAGATTAITLKLGDEFGVRGTHILCTVQLSKTFVPGQKIVGCLYATPKGPVPKTYAVALAVDGEVALGRVGANGAPKVIMRRKPAVLHAAGPKLYAVGIGSALIVKGTAITCGVSKQKFGGKLAVTVACFKINPARKPRPNSYGIGITDGGAFIVHFDAKSQGTPIKVVEHGK